MKIQMIIVEDEAPIREMVATIISNYFPEVTILATVGSVKEAMSAIKLLKPNFLLLDIQLPDGTGFDILSQLDRKDIAIVFLTAHEEYALKAFKFSALDYLLKPINTSELKAAIEKGKSDLERKNIELKLSAFLSNMQNSNKENKKIILKTAESIHLTNIKDIVRCEADKNYTQFFLNDGKKLLVSKTLKEFDDLVSGYGFFRTHQSHLVNINCIISYEKSDGGYLLLNDNSQVPVSKRKKEELIALFNKM